MELIDLGQNHTQVIHGILKEREGHGKYYVLKFIKKF